VNRSAPLDFSALEPCVAAWALPTLRQRRQRRLTSTLDELRKFHAAMLPHLESIIEFLNEFPVDDIPLEHRPLAWLALAMCEVDDPVSKWRSVTLDEALDPRKFTLKNSFYDTDFSTLPGNEAP
jgi:hypothetical protein